MLSTPPASPTTSDIRRLATTASARSTTGPREIGGFEGNAQTLRVLTRIEPKVFGPDGRSYGLNLTRASLDASCKYPWPEPDGIPDPSGRSKFGFYADDVAAFEWLRRDAPARRLCVEAQVMDLSDDIGYSVHDFEDAVFGGYIDVESLSARVNHDALVDSMFTWIGGELSHDELVAAFDRLDSLDVWLDGWDGSRSAQGRLKNLTSQLIGRFLGAAVTCNACRVSAGLAHPVFGERGGAAGDHGGDRCSEGDRRSERHVDECAPAAVFAPAVDLAGAGGHVARVWCGQPRPGFR